MVSPGAAATDAFGRRFRYLRLSVTEVCNFRCTYCLPNGYTKSGAMDFLAAEEVARLVRAFAGLGITKIRLTGGEPTVRKDIGQLIACAARQPFRRAMTSSRRSSAVTCIVPATRRVMLPPASPQA